MSSAHLLQRVGNIGLLNLPAVGFLASTRVPPDLWLATLDLVSALPQTGSLLIGGFHSPLERDACEAALAAGGSVVRIAAAPRAGVAASKLERLAFGEGRLLLLYPAEGERRVTARASGTRTQHVLQLSQALFIPAAAAGSRTYQAAVQATAAGIPARCFDHPRNIDLQILGVRVVDPKSEPAHLARVIAQSSFDRHMNPEPADSL